MDSAEAPEQWLERITLSVSSFLQQHRGVSNVQVSERPCAHIEDIEAWQSRNAPFSLPEDLRAFYSITNGMMLSWKMQFNEELIPLGCMHLNPISDILPIEDTRTTIRLNRSNWVGAGKSSFQVRAFNLDSMCLDGKVALVYDGDYSNPSVWFQDLSCTYFFVAKSFTDYLRLLIMHLGLPHWQYAFTTTGLPPISKQWFYFMTPERLAIDTRDSNKNASSACSTKESTETEQNDVHRQKKLKSINFTKIEKLASAVVQRQVKSTKRKEEDSMLNVESPQLNLVAPRTRPGSAPGKTRVSNSIYSNHNGGDTSYSKSHRLTRPDTAYRKGP